MVKEFAEYLSSDGMFDSLTVYIEGLCPDFPEYKKAYCECIEKIRSEFGTELEVTVDDMVTAFKKKMRADIIFAAHLGFKANLDYFKNPIANNFINVDAEIYLRENVSKRMPVHEEAQRVIDGFYDQLSREQKDLTDPLTDYESYLETVGPKLAHYIGFVFANRLLPFVEPGYSPDLVMTHAYQHMLGNYLNLRLPDSIEGITLS